MRTLLPLPGLEVPKTKFRKNQKRVPKKNVHAHRHGIAGRDRIHDHCHPRPSFRLRIVQRPLALKVAILHLLREFKIMTFIIA